VVSKGNLPRRILKGGRGREPETARRGKARKPKTRGTGPKKTETAGGAEGDGSDKKVPDTTTMEERERWGRGQGGVAPRREKPESGHRGQRGGETQQPLTKPRTHIKIRQKTGTGKANFKSTEYDCPKEWVGEGGQTDKTVRTDWRG